MSRIVGSSGSPTKPVRGSMSGVVTKRPAAIDAGLQLGLRNRWYPIFESRDLGSSKAIGIRRLGEDLALWHSHGSDPTMADNARET